MSFFRVQRSAAGSYSTTRPGALPPMPNPPRTYIFPLITLAYSSSSGVGNGAALVQRSEPLCAGAGAGVCADANVHTRTIAVAARIVDSRLTRGDICALLCGDYRP